MLHKRYDWTRTLFVASLCLTFFLGSQTSSVAHFNDSQEKVRGMSVAKPLVDNEKGINSLENNSNLFLYTKRR